MSAFGPLAGYPLASPQAIASGSGSLNVIISPSGGITFSGTSPNLREKLQPVSGGLSLAGTVIPRKERSILPSGQVTFSGAAPFSSTAVYQITPLGGVNFSGNPEIIKEETLESTGGTAFGGSSKLIFVPVGGVGANDSDRINVGVSRKVGVA